MMKNKLYRIISILLTVSILLSIASITPTYASIYREEDLEIIWLDKDYFMVEPFSEGLVAVRKGEKWGYINQQGKAVIPFIFEHVESFSEGLAFVKKRRSLGYP